MLSSHKTSLFKVAYFLFLDWFIQARVKNCIITVKGRDIGNVFLPTIPSIFEPCYFALPCIIPYHSLLGSTQLLSLGYSIENQTCKFSSGIWFSLRPQKQTTKTDTQLWVHLYCSGCSGQNRNMGLETCLLFLHSSLAELDLLDAWNGDRDNLLQNASLFRLAMDNLFTTRKFSRYVTGTVWLIVNYQ